MYEVYFFVFVFIGFCFIGARVLVLFFKLFRLFVKGFVRYISELVDKKMKLS